MHRFEIYVSGKKLPVTYKTLGHAEREFKKLGDGACLVFVFNGKFQWEKKREDYWNRSPVVKLIDRLSVDL